MKVKKLMDGTIQFQKDERDYKDIVYAVFFETNLVLLGSKEKNTAGAEQYFYDLDTDRKYGTIRLPEDQQKFEAGETLTMRPMPMTMEDYEVLSNEKLMLEMSGGQVMDAFSIKEKTFVLCPYIVVPHKETPSFKCLVFDREMHPVDGYAYICGSNPFAVMKEVMGKLGLDKESPVSLMETTSVLKRAGYCKWYYTYGDTASGITHMEAAAISRSRADGPRCLLRMGSRRTRLSVKLIQMRIRDF